MNLSPTKPLPRGEFIALIAVMFAIVALSIDAMLPALPDIAQAFALDNPNIAQLVITSFVFGMGLGTLFTGPLSDAFGRKTVIILGGLLYVVAALVCAVAPNMETLLIARLVMGLGAAGPRVAVIALVRDLYNGREMAKVMSFVMMIFILVPAIAPMMGQVVIWFAGWHMIFVGYVVFAAVAMAWLGLRQPETLPPAARRPLSIGALISATAEVLRIRIIIVSIAAQALTMGCLFAALSSMQSIFDQRFDRADSFPMWFAVIALASSVGSVINANVVVRIGMRRVVIVTYAVELILTLVFLTLILSHLLPEPLAFPVHILWTISLFTMMALTNGNLNALAMEPVGHIAGLAASVTGSLATVISVGLAVPVGMAFDGTPVPLMIGTALFVGLALILIRMAPRTKAA